MGTNTVRSSFSAHLTQVCHISQNNLIISLIQTSQPLTARASGLDFSFRKRVAVAHFVVCCTSIKVSEMQL